MSAEQSQLQSDQQSNIVTNTICRLMEVRLTPAELLARAEHEATILEQIDDARADFFERKKEYKKHKKALKKQLKDTQRVIRYRTEERTIECIEELNLTRGLATIVRVDTGEIIETRPLTKKDFTVLSLNEKVKKQRAKTVASITDHQPPATDHLSLATDQQPPAPGHLSYVDAASIQPSVEPVTLHSLPSIINCESPEAAAELADEINSAVATTTNVLGTVLGSSSVITISTEIAIEPTETLPAIAIAPRDIEINQFRDRDDDRLIIKLTYNGESREIAASLAADILTRTPHEEYADMEDLEAAGLDAVSTLGPRELEQLWDSLIKISARINNDRKLELKRGDDIQVSPELCNKYFDRFDYERIVDFTQHDLQRLWLEFEQANKVAASQKLVAESSEPAYQTDVTSEEPHEDNSDLGTISAVQQHDGSYILFSGQGNLTIENYVARELAKKYETPSLNQCDHGQLQEIYKYVAVTALSPENTTGLPGEPATNQQLEVPGSQPPAKSKKKPKIVYDGVIDWDGKIGVKYTDGEYINGSRFFGPSVTRETIKKVFGKDIKKLNQKQLIWLLEQHADDKVNLADLRYDPNAVTVNVADELAESIESDPLRISPDWNPETTLFSLHRGDESITLPAHMHSTYFLETYKTSIEGLDQDQLLAIWDRLIITVKFVRGYYWLRQGGIDFTVDDSIALAFKDNHAIDLIEANQEQLSTVLEQTIVFNKIAANSFGYDGDKKSKDKAAIDTPASESEPQSEQPQQSIEPVEPGYIKAELINRDGTLDRIYLERDGEHRAVNDGIVKFIAQMGTGYETQEQLQRLWDDHSFEIAAKTGINGEIIPLSGKPKEKKPRKQKEPKSNESKADRISHDWDVDNKTYLLYRGNECRVLPRTFDNAYFKQKFNRTLDTMAQSLLSDIWECLYIEVSVVTDIYDVANTWLKRSSGTIHSVMVPADIVAEHQASGGIESLDQVTLGHLWNTIQAQQTKPAIEPPDTDDIQAYITAGGKLKLATSSRVKTLHGYNISPITEKYQVEHVRDLTQEQLIEVWLQYEGEVETVTPAKG